MQANLAATPVAIEMVERLTAEHGPLVFFQSGGCCDGTAPICLKKGELPPSGNDLLLGEIAGAPFYVDCEQYARWGHPSFLIDAGSGPAEGFSLSLPDAHFVTRAPAAPAGPGVLVAPD
jgi:uncharacterized protein (DUF779 family)